MTDFSRLHVAVAIIRNQGGQVLIALRDKNKHQGGLWEFPGGKVEAGESVSEALARELEEELDLQVKSSTPLLKIEHDYEDKKVLLDVSEVLEYQGEARGLEGQPINWVKLEQLEQYQFPEANLAIVKFLLSA